MLYDYCSRILKKEMLNYKKLLCKLEEKIDYTKVTLKINAS